MVQDVLRNVVVIEHSRDIRILYDLLIKERDSLVDSLDDYDIYDSLINRLFLDLD